MKTIELTDEEIVALITLISMEDTTSSMEISLQYVLDKLRAIA